jgi:hypothetical protein
MGKKLQQLLDDLKETRRYWNLKGEELDGTVLRTVFGRGCGPVVRETKNEGIQYLANVSTTFSRKVFAIKCLRSYARYADWVLSIRYRDLFKSKREYINKKRNSQS